MVGLAVGLHGPSGPLQYSLSMPCRVLDLSCNQLVCLAPLSALSALRVLNLQGNCITHSPAAGGSLPPGAFPRLEELDLSYNALTPEGLHSLAQLPRLRHLNVSGVCMRRANTDTAQALLHLASRALAERAACHAPLQGTPIAGREMAAASRAPASLRCAACRQRAAGWAAAHWRRSQRCRCCSGWTSPGML